MTANQLEALVGLDTPYGLVPIPGTAASADYLRHWDWLFPFSSGNTPLTGSQLTVFQGQPATGITVALSTASGLAVAPGTLTPGINQPLATTLETINSPTSLLFGLSFAISTATGLTVAQGTLLASPQLVSMQLTVGSGTQSVTHVNALTSPLLSTAPGSPVMAIVVPLTTPTLTIGQGSLAAPMSFALTSTFVNVQGGTITANSSQTTVLASQLLTVSQGTSSPAITVALTGQQLQIQTTNPLATGVGQTTLNSQAMSVAPGVITTSIATPLTDDGGLTVIPGNPVAVPTLPLTGSGLTTNQGTLSPASNPTLTPQLMTVAQGTPTISVPGTVVLGGATTLIVGTTVVTAASTTPLTTTLLTVTPGPVGLTAPLTGSLLTVSPGTITRNVAVVLTGFSLTVNPGIITPSGSHPIVSGTGKWRLPRPQIFGGNIYKRPGRPDER